MGGIVEQILSKSAWQANDCRGLMRCSPSADLRQLGAIASTNAAYLVSLASRLSGCWQ